MLTHISDLSPAAIAAIQADHRQQAGISSSVHPEETSATPPAFPCRQSLLPPLANGRQRKRHQFWLAERQRVYDALAAAGAAPSALESFSHCGEDAFLLRSKANPADHKFGLNTCRNRWCQPCQRERAAVIQANLQPLLASVNSAS